MIVQNAFICRPITQGEEFSKDVGKAINNMQSLNLTVEMQYQINNNAFTVIIIGRKAK